MHSTTLQRGYTKSGLYWIEVSGGSGHRSAAQRVAEMQEEEIVAGVKGGKGHEEIPRGILGYCDMVRMIRQACGGCR